MSIILSQALANILTAVQKGVTVVDSSTAGLGGRFYFEYISNLHFFVSFNMMLFCENCHFNINQDVHMPKEPVAMSAQKMW